MRWLCFSLFAALLSSAPDARAECTTPQIVGWVLGSAGAAGVVAGAVTAGLTFEQQDINEAHCDDATRTCDARGIEAHERGEVLGAVTTATWIASGALLAAGLVLVVSGGEAPATVSLTTGPARAELTARW